MSSLPQLLRGRFSRPIVARLAAFASLAIALMSLFGILTESRVLAAPLFSRNIVVLNTVVCAIGMSLGILCKVQRWRVAATGLFGAVLLIAMIVTLERTLKLGSVMDTPALHLWAHDTTRTPGRMSFNVCFGMVILSVAALLQTWQPSRRTARIAQLMASAAMLAGLLGLTGNNLALDFLYHSLGLAQIAPAAALLLILPAIGIIALGARPGLRVVPDDFRLNQVTRTVVVLVAAVTGLASFALMQKRLEQSLAEQLSERLSERASYMATSLYDYRQRAGFTISDETLAQRVADAANNPNGASRAQLFQFMHGLLPIGFSAIAYVDANDRPIASLGEFRHPLGRAGIDLVPLAQNDASDQLGWHHGYYLYSRRELRLNGELVGYALGEQPLNALARLTSLAGTAGASAEVSLCSVSLAPVMCFPTSQHDQPFRLDAAVDPVEAALVPRGVNEPSGMERSLGRNSEPLLAAFRPIPGTGLVMVMTSDLTDVYAPVRSAFQSVLPLIILLALGGIVVVRLFVRPLVRQLLAARRDAVSSEARFRAAAEGSLDALFILEPVLDPFGDIRDFRFMYANSNGEKLLRMSGAALRATPLSQAVAQFQKSGWFTRYLRVLESGESVGGNVLVRLPGMDGSWIYQHVAPLGDGLAVTVRDISRQKATEEKLRHAAQTDSLTGLPNRALLLDRIERALLRATRRPNSIALLYLDLDGFKQVNDHYGHAAGDIVLMEFARRLVKGVRAEDTVARLGGDEFCVLVENLDGRAEAFRIADALLLSARLPITTPDQTLRITTSIGIAFGHPGEQSASQFLARADSALYQVKRRGRNAYFGEEVPETESATAK